MTKVIPLFLFDSYRNYKLGCGGVYSSGGWHQPVIQFDSTKIGIKNETTKYFRYKK